MPDNIETMTDHELLMELVKDQQRREKKEKTRRYISLAVLLVILALLLFCVPKVIRLYRDLYDALKQINAVAEKVNGTLEGIDTKALNDILEKLQKVISMINPFKN
ncbi:MAG: hypothetical protein IKE06_04545 [Solobacterium sp.]|nr:hypothetical protein [Solobacterium sp.]